MSLLGGILGGGGGGAPVKAESGNQTSIDFGDETYGPIPTPAAVPGLGSESTLLIVAGAAVVVIVLIVLLIRK
jgi:hypothetical protein